ncbi:MULTISPECIES: glycosyltransferase family 4 protein [unclassified Carboxylicivirga]|uniref:glycosyltransferase family 4 protein n=1 Tax=Carboxylicivirga TaxID=1628153 RepID=UPI003D341164
MHRERLKLGILFNFQPSWMGGIIYIINIVKTLNFLDDEEKPAITLFYKPELVKFLNEFDEYPYLKKVEYDYPSLVKGNVKSWLLRKNLFVSPLLKKYELDVIYPLQDYPVRTKTKVKLVSWSADFQNKHYPEFFTKKNLIGRHQRVNNALKNTDNLVLSSHDAHKDLKHFFKVRDGINVHIYHFVSIIDKVEDVNMKELRAKYDLPDKYYIISNQFHRHKNHKVVLLALAKMKKMGIRIHLAMTGKMPDASVSPYMGELHAIIDENKLNDQISLLGIISRNDQLQLMRHSQAVIQPSLFEGWSTVIEDARSLQVPVIASSLGVNIEQLGDDHGYFDPHNVDQLVEILKDYPERNMGDMLYDPYEKRVKEAAQTLMKILSPV